MEDQTVLLVVLTGLLFRLGIPLVITITAIMILRKVDAYWQAEAKAEAESVDESALVEKEKCWEFKECDPEMANDCPAANSPLPCWQVMRQKNGYLREECLNCRIFQQAPTPVRIHSYSHS